MRRLTRTIALLGCFGLIEPARAADDHPSRPQTENVFSEVGADATIVSILADGSRVKKGDKVCELESPALLDDLKSQKITAAQAGASYEQARLTREVAEVAVVEYKNGIFVQDLKTVQGEIALAKSDVTRAQDRLVWTTKMVDKGFVSRAQKVADDLNLQTAKFSLEQGNAKKDVLIKYTKEKTVKELGSEVEKARADELTKKATLDLERARLVKLERQVGKCAMVAPIDGVVSYAKPSRLIGLGATVCDQQLIFRVVPTRGGPLSSH
jgi:HlyD family secretion protein